jgi:hypothetical protein
MDSLVKGSHFEYKFLSHKETRLIVSEMFALQQGTIDHSKQIDAH